MTASVLRKAVVITCDDNHLPYAATVFHSIARMHPDRDFDMLLATAADLTLPPVLEQMGVQLLKMELPPEAETLKSSRLPRTAYLRLWLPKQLAADYDRLIYLDTDVWVQREGLDRLFDADLGTHPVGAVLERPMWARPRRKVRDQRRLGLEKAPYFNSGLLLIDVAKWLQADVLSACLEAGRLHGKKFQYHDQSLLNFALYRNWAQLHPAWNWQWTFYHPMAEAVFDPVVLHVYGPDKPWNDPKGLIPARIKAEFRLFLNAHFPDRPQNYGPVRARRDGNFLKLSLKNLRDMRNFRRYESRFADEFDTLLQQD